MVASLDKFRNPVTSGIFYYFHCNMDSPLISCFGIDVVFLNHVIQFDGLFR